MKNVLYIALDQKHRVVSSNFWFSVESRINGTWRKVHAFRSADAAISVCI